MDAESVAKLVSVLMQLLPGFVAAWVFFGLTQYEKPPVFERIVHALVLTAIIRAVSSVVKQCSWWIAANCWRVGAWDAEVEHAVGVSLGFGLGVAFSWVANRDTGLFAWLRAKQLTSKTSFPNSWAQTLAEHLNKQTVDGEKIRIDLRLTLKDGRMLCGRPDLWPDDPKSGYFHLEEPQWFSGENHQVVEPGVSILISNDMIAMVELVDFIEVPVGQGEQDSENDT